MIHQLNHFGMAVLEFFHGVAQLLHVFIHGLRVRHGGRLVGFVLLAVFAQIFRNWLLLRAVGVDASFFDAIAVLIAVVMLGQLPVGPSVGAAAAVLILGQQGVAATGAAGLLMTVTGTVGGLAFLAWAGADRLWFNARRLSSA